MKIIRPIPEKVYLACSGGIDSMFALHFLMAGGRDVTPLYFNHGTEFGQSCENFLKSLDIGAIYGKIEKTPEKGRSLEDFWRECRYEFLDQFTDAPVVTAHHLDDQIETLLQGLCHGRLDRVIPHRRGNYIRPFIYVSKQEIKDYAHRHSLTYLNDPSNEDVRFTRNRIRNKIIPELLEVNPGFYKSIKKLINPVEC
jgi:tRNA(Ile)-lysidine synthetase-like protein